MKKLFFALALFVSISTFSQIELIETTKTEVVGRVEFVYLEKIGDESYNLFYKNMNNPVKEYVNFSFNNVNNDADKLHQIMVNGFTEMPRDPYKVKANGDIVWLKYEKVQEVPVLQIQQYVSRDPDVMTVSKYLTLDEVNKIFKK